MHHELRTVSDGQPIDTKWITHPVTNVTTVTITTDRACLLIEPTQDPSSP